MRDVIQLKRLHYRYVYLKGTRYCVPMCLLHLIDRVYKITCIFVLLFFIQNFLLLTSDPWKYLWIPLDWERLLYQNKHNHS